MYVCMYIYINYTLIYFNKVVLVKNHIFLLQIVVCVCVCFFELANLLIVKHIHKHIIYLQTFILDTINWYLSI